jgi:hypothetical protein
MRVPREKHHRARNAWHRKTTLLFRDKRLQTRHALLEFLILPLQRFDLHLLVLDRLLLPRD